MWLQNINFTNAGIAQRLVHWLPKPRMTVRFCLPALKNDLKMLDFPIEKEMDYHDYSFLTIMKDEISTNPFNRKPNCNYHGTNRFHKHVLPHDIERENKFDINLIIL